MKTSIILKYFFSLSFLVLLLFQYSNAQVTDTIYVEAGWNLLSLPLKVTDGAKSTLFPSATSDAFIFQEYYLAKDTIEPGYGFWLKFNSADTLIITGEAVREDTINVQPGWNIVGAQSLPVAVNTIITEPYGIITSQYFSYNPAEGYKISDTLWPGNAYWIKILDPGELHISQPCPGLRLGWKQYLNIVEYDGKFYHTVPIGNRCWLKENLDVGIMIDGSDTANHDFIIEKYCYNDDPSNCETYGGLYQWDEAMAYWPRPGNKGICPTGWHIPTLEEYQALRRAVGSDGNSLKSIGQGSGDGAGTNTNGFSAFMAGYRNSNGLFDYLGNVALFWSSTASDFVSARGMYLNGVNNGIDMSSNSSKDYGFSIRCIMDLVEPVMPSNPIPKDNSVEIDTNTTISWTCSSPVGLKLKYDVYFDNFNPPQKVSSDQSDTFYVANGLHRFTSYYWKVVAKDETGNMTASLVWRFTTNGYGEKTHCLGLPTLIYEGRTYSTVKIGNQCWLRENLNVGTQINDYWSQTDDDEIEKYCYDDFVGNCEIYGGLYQWDEAMQYATSEGMQGICPLGWHIPKWLDYEELTIYLHSDGQALKSISMGGTDTSGFSALLGGCSTDNGFLEYGQSAYFWSSRMYGESAYYMNLYWNSSSIGFPFYAGKSNGFSVRCLKD